MPGMHAQVALQDGAGNLGDVYINTWSCATTNVATPEDGEWFLDAVIAFYTNVQASGFSISTYLGEQVNGGALAHEAKIYDLSGIKLSGGVGNPLGAPIATRRFTVDPSDATSPLPNEVAACITLEGAGRSSAAVELGTPPNVSRPKQRHTGRVYLGPLNTNAIYPGPAGFTAHLHPTLVTTAHQAVQEMHNDLQASGLLGLAVWSRANASLYVLEGVSTDLAPDVVRSRGIKSGTGRVRAAIN